MLHVWCNERRHCTSIGVCVFELCRCCVIARGTATTARLRRTPTSWTAIATASVTRVQVAPAPVASMPTRTASVTTRAVTTAQAMCEFSLPRYLAVRVRWSERAAAVAPHPGCGAARWRPGTDFRAAIRCVLQVQPRADRHGRRRSRRRLVRRARELLSLPRVYDSDADVVVVSVCALPRRTATTVSATPTQSRRTRMATASATCATLSSARRCVSWTATALQRARCRAQTTATAQHGAPQTGIRSRDHAAVKVRRRARHDCTDTPRAVLCAAPALAVRGLSSMCPPCLFSPSMRTECVLGVLLLPGCMQCCERCRRR